MHKNFLSFSFSFSSLFVSKTLKRKKDRERPRSGSELSRLAPVRDLRHETTQGVRQKVLGLLTIGINPTFRISCGFRRISPKEYTSKICDVPFCCFIWNPVALIKTPFSKTATNPSKTGKQRYWGKEQAITWPFAFFASSLNLFQAPSTV